MNICKECYFCEERIIRGWGGRPEDWEYRCTKDKESQRDRVTGVWYYESLPLCNDLRDGPWCDDYERAG